MEQEWIEVFGAREHNLKNIDTKIPRDQLVVITGLSGSGKSSLAFDTIYAEGQRRYIETFSAYARQFLGGLERPDVDKITGLSPVISIEQKTVSKNPRSTVGTITEIYDFLRLLFARAGEAYSYNSGEKMVKYSDQQIVELIIDQFNDKKLLLMAPIIKGRKGHYRELFEQLRKQGFTKVRIDGDVQDLMDVTKVDRYKIHDIEIVIDRIHISESSQKRLSDSIKLAMKHGKGMVLVQENGSDEVKHYSRFLMCPTSGISYSEPEPNLFSFNSPYGACPTCNGLGEVTEADIDKIIPNRKLSVKKGGIAPLGDLKNSWVFQQIETILEHHKFKITSSLEDVPEEILKKILFGTDEFYQIETVAGINRTVSGFEGVVNFILRHYQDSPSNTVKRWAESFMNKKSCPSCEGKRLKKEAYYFKIAECNVAELATMGLDQLSNWFENVEEKLSKKQLLIASELLKEIRSRIRFLLGVGLGYLTLNRGAKSLSGGEAQRIRLATQIGSELVGVLYILDEPSIGLHQRDNSKLIKSLEKLRDSGNSVLVVEHDKEMIEKADYVLDIGPGAGIEGGFVIDQGTPEQLSNKDSLTYKYLSGVKEISIPKKRRKGNGKKLKLNGATGNNLKDVSAEFPLGKMICVTGVSGSGKSTLINQTLHPILSSHFFNSTKKTLEYKSIKGLEHLDKVIAIDQSPIGRTPRSNPATYTGMFTDIRNLFAQLPEAKIRGYKPGRFSFNIKGGRCETCKGGGLKVVEMNFLPDVYVNCETCNGKRYNKETLEVRYKGKSISDVLDMRIEDAALFFEGIPSIHRKLQTLQSVGLGYLSIGQPSTTLSGGEAQRVKLSTELSRKDTGQTFYILDEPTTGLHFEDIRLLLEVLTRLVESGNTVLVIEHNMDIIKVADHVIDVGPEGGNGGGEIIATGTPEQIAGNKNSITGVYLKQEL